jgi:hypothetical protein
LGLCRNPVSKIPQEIGAVADGPLKARFTVSPYANCKNSIALSASQLGRFNFSDIADRDCNAHSRIHATTMLGAVTITCGSARRIFENESDRKFRQRCLPLYGILPT